MIAQNFGQLVFFKIYFLLFEKEQTYINNQNQEAFIVIIINYKLRVYQLILFLFLRPTDPIFL